MNITKTSSEAQKERDNANKLVYRRIKARRQGSVCPECGKSHWQPNVIEHYQECEHYFKFACESCGCEWQSNVYNLNWNTLYALEAKVPATNMFSWWIIRSKFTRDCKKDMKTLEEGYDPSVDYSREEEKVSKDHVYTATELRGFIKSYLMDNSLWNEFNDRPIFLLKDITEESDTTILTFINGQKFKMSVEQLLEEK